MKKPQLIRRMLTHVSQYHKRYLVMLAVLSFGFFGTKQIGEWFASQLEVNELTIEHPDWAASTPIKIAFFADVHNDKGKFQIIVNLIRNQKPDLIIFGGDLVMADQRFMRTAWAIDGFRELCAIAPTYAILGNHDYEKQEQVERVYQTAGVNLLRNESVIFKDNSGKLINIIGLGDHNEGDDNPEAFRTTAPGLQLPTLLISHDPESRHDVSQEDWDIMLSGHTHGGQLGIPFTDHYISFRSSMPAGLYDYTNGRKVFVTRGVGAILGMRFFCYPEVNFITIQAPSND